jgi:hypothetical protein
VGWSVNGIEVARRRQSGVEVLSVVVAVVVLQLVMAMDTEDDVMVAWA